MRRLVCKTDLGVDLESHLASPGEMVLALHPEASPSMIHLNFSQRQGFKAVASRLKQDAFAFPNYVKETKEIPSQTYFLITQDERGVLALFCLSHQRVRTSLSGTPEGFALEILYERSHVPHQTNRDVLVCVRGIQLNATVSETVRLALQLTGGIGKPIEEKLSSPDWLNRLGWESGLALGNRVSHGAILDSIEHLQKSGCYPGYALIDEGWQHLVQNPDDKRQRDSLYNFDADPLRFPRGIQGLVQDLHKIGIKHVGVWHGMLGYQEGLHPKLAQPYQISKERDGRYFLGADLGRTFQFFNDYYAYLRQKGVTFIKVSGKTPIPGGTFELTSYSKNLQSAIQAAASIQFNSAHFNTDCLRNENLFYWGNSRLARAAGDIDLSNPLGLMRSIRNNLSNSLWLQHFMQPDFDAWLTSTPENEALAIFHALSGTINVIGDLPGQHNIALLKKMVLPNGSLLKADRPLTLCEDSVFVNPLEEKKIYKAYTVKGQYGILGAFNLTAGKRSLQGQISTTDIPALEGNHFAVFSYHNGFSGLLKAGEKLSITLKPQQSDVLTFAPVKKGVAVLGCYPFFLAPGPLVEVIIQEDSLQISTLVAASLLVYCEREVLEVRRDGATIPWEYDRKRHILSIDTHSHIEGIKGEYSICNVLFES